MGAPESVIAASRDGEANGARICNLSLGSGAYTEEFASLMKEKMAKNGNFVFLFGSSFGLDDSLRKRADVSFSLSKLTFTHYMALYLTLEQCYRAMKILKGESYDK